MFNPKSLFQQLQSFPKTSCYWIALSGGVDSMALLHAMKVIRDELSPLVVKAVHINHQLQEPAQMWSRQCKHWCEEWNIPLEVIKVDLKISAGESIEACARDARYQAFSQLLQDDEIILTAHQQDDQAETVLLQLLRGSGLPGLAAMPPLSKLGKGWLARPLLNFSREELVAYLVDHAIVAIDDPMNQDLRFNRNFLRHQIMPLLKTRWPECNETLSRSAKHCAEAEILLKEMAQEKLISLQGKSRNTLSVNKLTQTSLPIQRLILRHWLKNMDLDIPSEQQLLQIQETILASRYDATPKMLWGNTEIHRYGDDVYALTKLSWHDISWRDDWNFLQPLLLPNNLGKLYAQPSVGEGISRQKLAQAKTISVRFRQGGEHIKLINRQGTHELKKLFQEWRVEPWLRDRIPLIFVDGKLICVVGHAVDKDYLTEKDEKGWIVIIKG